MKQLSTNDYLGRETSSGRIGKLHHVIV